MNIEIDYSDVTDMVNEMMDANEHLPLPEIEELAVESVHQNFDSGGRPDAWDPAILPMDRPLLVDTGALRESIEAVAIDTNRVSLDSPLDYAAYLNEGTDKMVARPFMLLQQEDVDEIETIVAQHYVSDEE